MDFTTTAMARPDIVYETYYSFNKNLKDIDLKKCRLFINIDPLPEDVNREDVVKVCSEFFGEVIHRMPDKPNYTAAYNWLWRSAKTNIIFNLEDDWELLEQIPVYRLIEFFDFYPNLFEVALRAYPYKYDKCPTSPSFMHRRFYGAVGGKLNENINPETQLRGKNFGIEMPGLEVPNNDKLVAYPKDRIIVKDIGRKWLNNSNYKKPNCKKCHFTAWEKK